MNHQPSRKAYADYLDAKCSETPDGEYTPDAVGRMQRAILVALQSDDPLPVEMRRDLAFAFENLCTGIAFPLLLPVKKPGGREPPIAKRMQEAAIRYLRWADDGRIIDASPVATVANAFDVEARTVRNWRNSWENKPIPELFAGYGAIEVAKFMKAVGGQYRRFIPKPKAKLIR